MDFQKRINVVAALIKKNKKLLLSQRKENDSFGLLWEFPGGRVEKNEKLEDAIVREMKEELGILVKPKKLIGKFFDNNIYITVYLFSCKIEGGEFLNNECNDFGFFSYKEVKELKLAPVDKKIFNYICKMNL